MEWARKALYTIVGWFVLVGVAVAAMAVAMQLNNDPNASSGAMVMFIVVAVVLGILAVLLYRPLFRDSAA